MSFTARGEPVGAGRNGNCLINSLPLRQRKAVKAQCEPVDLAVGTVLCKAGEPFEYAYFPVAGCISLTRTLTGHRSLEIDSIGKGGMLGATLILNIPHAPQNGVVQAPGFALRMEVRRLKKALKGYPALSRVVQRYLYVVLLDLARATSCINFHDVGKRLAVSLLRSHDHALKDQFDLTHVVLAEMLGVQRGAVTLAASKLQRQGIIRYRRGRVSILDRKGLEGKACGCYRAATENYASIFS